MRLFCRERHEAGSWNGERKPFEKTQMEQWIMVSVKETRFPSQEIYITLTFTEMEIRHLLLDLESESKVHRYGTVDFKHIAKKWLKECDEMRRNI